MISSQNVSLYAQETSPKTFCGCNSSSIFARRLSLNKPNTVSSPSLPPRAFRASSFRESKFERVFRYFDEDGDGKISALELCNCLRSMGEELSAEDAEAFLESSDADGDGKLGYEGFLKLVEVEEDVERERTLREAFAAFEMAGMGCITERSLRSALQRLGKEKKLEECSDMIKKFDLNGDGVICFDEFKLMML
ncbi:putative calcium-binding protein CML19 [Dendrobium catenatum]|uniref:Putative calcium-binding protein CML31 n=1 Tax=Dendrobium catenatum TaxID=906689 RepID=A0A2I0VHL8_9ASPA|nr:putative calcium-binding protein CML19 [Dendrobium catenatum]PKU62901.1 putative calcium-binding protein CML31 [Dendrobium catenatum]